jgi:hypothetical protein
VTSEIALATHASSTSLLEAYARDITKNKLRIRPSIHRESRTATETAHLPTKAEDNETFTDELEVKVVVGGSKPNTA